jgi:hypothetical protein
MAYAGYSSDDARSRAELAAGLHTVADLIGSNEDFEIIRAFVESVLSDAVDRFDRLEHDDLAAGKWDRLRFSERALEEYELDESVHTCVDGRPDCWVCSQTRMGGAS